MEKTHNIVDEYLLLKKWLGVIFKFQGKVKNKVFYEKWEQLLTLYQKHRFFEVNEINGKTQLMFEVEGKKCQVLVSFIQNDKHQIVFQIDTDARSRQVVHEFKDKVKKFVEENKRTNQQKQNPSHPQEVEQFVENHKPVQNVETKLQETEKETTVEVKEHQKIQDELFEEITQFAKQFR